MASKKRSRVQHHQGHRKRAAVDNTGVIPQLAKAAREVEAAAVRGRISPANRTKFQVVALLMREERARLKTSADVSDSERNESMKRLDGLAAILAKTAARDTSLIDLLKAEAPTTPQARALRKQMLFAGGVDMVVDDEPTPEPEPIVAKLPEAIRERQVLPTSVKTRVRSSPFLAPKLENLRPHIPHYSRLHDWELLGPILKAFETGAGGGAASMELPQPPRFDRVAPAGRELMPHQAALVESVRQGHRQFLLADEPGLGKTAQSVLAASVADAYPLLCVVPNVVKTNWAQEVERWTPGRRATVISGDGEDVDAFADVFIVNYEILDRHIGWLRRIGFRGMVVDEAHFIKNLQSQRSRLVMELANSIRAHVPGDEPLLMALTGTPLINDVEDFRAIWQFLGWVEASGNESGVEFRPSQELLDRLDATGLVPSDPGFLAAARRAVIDMGIVRRRKIDVATSLPSKRIIDMPIELDTEEGASIRRAEQLLVARLLARYDRMLAAADLAPGTIDLARIRMLARHEVEESKASSSGDSIFKMLHRIGVAKSQLAAEYAAQLAHSVGKVVYFAKHVEAMDRAEATFAAEGVRSVSIRGDQSTAARDRAIEAFQTDPEVQVIVCSLMAAGVGINLQVASDVVLAELSWTAAEQTQAIDRVHRIGQEAPVTAWRILASQTIDGHVAELIDSKQGLAARALEGTDAGEQLSDDIQVEALVQLVLEGLQKRR
ncbi:DEAD/DEAH box helicase [Gulosibacter macacae]|uniref:DEAD/DEAH box helicase n=1 Tax=Gulosibacter macacae TaxID=2488791 RepID=A0A3P3W192_9MICO|nr:DEAD/DEAH box helicase [Gulosibacter macacae]RRJ88740.1 DEAD/DEAH box helicase [Gulosibacter macacae]